MTFAELSLSEPILRAVAHEGYTVPTPIQAQAIPHIVAGKDVLGCAQTGTGKTAAFSLPILHRLSAVDLGAAHPHPNQHRHRAIRALILSPTRELALQIDESLRTYGRHTHLRTACIFGGVNQNPQTRALRAGVDILVATPGRLIDLMEQGHVDLSHVQVFVLDEADRMLDMGFIQPIRRIVSEVPEQRQTLLFSATMPKEIRHLADALLKNPVSVQVAAVAATPDLVDQHVVFVSKRDKPALLADFLNAVHVDRALVFTRTKHGADRVTRDLNRAGIRADAIHGNKRQNVRQRTLAEFRSGKTWVLVATDIAARGIDVDGVSHVVNFDLPNEPETYVHRIGRTARAGASGMAVSFCDKSSEERDYLRLIERLIRKQIPVKDFGPGAGEGHAAEDRRAPQPQERTPRIHTRPVDVPPRRGHGQPPVDQREPRPQPDGQPQTGRVRKPHRKGQSFQAQSPQGQSGPHSSRTPQGPRGHGGGRPPHGPGKRPHGGGGGGGGGGEGAPAGARRDGHRPQHGKPGARSDGAHPARPHGKPGFRPFNAHNRKSGRPAR